VVAEGCERFRRWHAGFATASEKEAKSGFCLFDRLEEDVQQADPNPEDVGAGSNAIELEIQRWSALPAERVDAYREDCGMINEYKLLFDMRQEFPLHFFLFRQTCVHIAHEANAENTFSLSGSLSNENTHTGSCFLSRSTRIQSNKCRLKPDPKLVLKRYLAKYRKPTPGEDVEDVAEAESDEGGEEDADEEGARPPEEAASPHIVLDN